MDIMTNLKNIAAVLGTVSTLAYVSGYLVLRSRAHALGTDPVSTLVDEAYVFAGFRFIFIMLIVLLLLAPAVLLARLGLSWLVSHISTNLMNTCQWLALGLVAGATIATFKLLSVKNVLLRQYDAGTLNAGLQEAYNRWSARHKSVIDIPARSSGNTVSALAKKGTSVKCRRLLRLGVDPSHLASDIYAANLPRGAIC